MSLDRFYPIFDHSDWLVRMLPLGVRLVQMRLKNMSKNYIYAVLQCSKKLCDAAGAVMVVNDYWEMAIELQCDWVHLGQEDLAEADMAAIKRAGLKIGISTHDEEELDRLLAHAEPEYLKTAYEHNEDGEVIIDEFKCFDGSFAYQPRKKREIWLSCFRPLPMDIKKSALHIAGAPQLHSIFTGQEA